MQLHPRLFCALLGAVAIAVLAGCATNGGTAPVATQQSRSQVPLGPGWIWKDGVLYHQPHYMLPRGMRSKHATSPADVMVYGNGPVLVSPKVYLIFWGYQKYGDPDGLMPLLERYIGNMGGSGHNNIYTQYYEMSGSTKTYVTNPTSQLGGVWMDNNHEPYSPTDAQIAQQAIDSIATFGYDPNGSYVVATPSGRNSNGFWHQYCAYHGAVYYNSNYISYTNFPYQPDAGSFCGSDFLKVRPRDEKALDEGVTIIEGHEEGESATDPVPGSGWVDGYGNEIGDVCAWEDIANDPFGRYSFTMQPMFSNATGTCVQSY